MFKRLKVRLYPTIKQKKMLDNHFDAYRFCYNLCLEYKSSMWKWYRIKKTGYDMQNELFELRRHIPWLNSCKAECIREAALCVDRSYKSFFKGKGFPKFKSKNCEKSFTANQSISCKNYKIRFYGTLIKYKTSSDYIHFLETGKIKKCTFKRDVCGNYWASCLIELPNIVPLAKNVNIIGVDLGLKDLLITSNGVVYPNNKYLISSKYRLTTLQRRFSKTQKGGKNREKLRIKVAKIYRKTVRQKEHYYHQITNELIRDNQTIVMETLKIKNMMGNHKLARNISDASWGLLTTMLEYKCAWNGRGLIKISQWYPSSKTCSSCGSVKAKLSLAQRTYTCECGLSIDRDLNAALNIRNSGLKIPGVPTEIAGCGIDEVGSDSLITNN